MLELAALTSPGRPDRISYAEAMALGLGEAMAADDRVFLIGHFFGLSRYRVFASQLTKAFPDRTWDPPIAEIGYVGTGIGAAISGLRPIVDLSTSSFMFQAFSQIANEAANIRYMTGGQTSVPLVLHANHGIRGGGAAQHSHSPQAMLMNTPGLQIVTPATPRDVRGLIRTAVESEDPVVWLDHSKLFDVVGDVPREPERIEFGVADTKRRGSDVTVVASSWMVQVALAAADAVAAEGIGAEVIDLRTLVPLDRMAILESVGRTHRLVVVDECHRRCGVAAEITSIVAEEAFDQLVAPIRRVTTDDVPVPFSAVLEQTIEPTHEKVAAAIRSVMEPQRRR